MEGAPSVAGLVSAAAGVSVLVAVGSVVVVVFFFLEKRDFSLSRGDSPMLTRCTGGVGYLMAACAGGDEDCDVAGSDV